MVIDEDKQRLLIEAAKERYGITDHCSRGGYILPNGDILDFGDPYDKRSKTRMVDHSEITFVFDEAGVELEHSRFEKCGYAQDQIDDFMRKTNSIRLSQSGDFTMRGAKGGWGELTLETNRDTKITRRQWETIEYCNCVDKNESIFLELTKCLKTGWDTKAIGTEVSRQDCVGAVNDLVKKYNKEVSATIDI